jgi:hypothetical protein
VDDSSGAGAADAVAAPEAAIRKPVPTIAAPAIPVFTYGARAETLRCLDNLRTLSGE